MKSGVTMWVALRDAVRERRRISVPPAEGEYPLANLRARITRALREQSGRADVPWEADVLERARFGADLAVRLNGLLKEVGPKEYIASHVPWMVEAMRSPALRDVVGAVSHKGIYVNVKLTDDWYLASVKSIVDLDSRFGLNDSRSARTHIVDYSSPNVAKVLHAGHLRSTMIGHVLGNFYEACGALVYRINHINDFGGFGFMLEGYGRFEAHFPSKLVIMTGCWRSTPSGGSWSGRWQPTATCTPSAMPTARSSPPTSRA